MRRKDREILDIHEIYDIANRCDTIRLGIQGNEFPYVVPVSFGAVLNGQTITIYFHCATEGMKIDLLRRNPKVCVEADVFYKTEKTDHGITTRYESVIGFGTCELLEAAEEKTAGLRAVLDHYGYFDYPLQQCRALTHTLVGKITVETITGKRNLPEASVPAFPSARP